MIHGHTAAANASGVYAFTATIELNPGRNILTIKNPGNLFLASQANYAGKFLYRFVYPEPDTINNAVRGASGAVARAAFGSLALGRTVSVENFLSPGGSVTLPVDEQFARIGWAIAGFAYTANVRATGLDGTQIGNIDWRSSMPMVEGWTGFGGANNSVNIGTIPAQTLHVNYSDPGHRQIFGPAAGNATHTVSTGADLITRTWDLPLDVTSPIPSDLGTLTFKLPELTIFRYDWTGQTSPFLDVDLTITWVKDYPMLSQLSDLTLRNWDNNEDRGHSWTWSKTQTPTAIFRVQASAMWWRARVAFSGVVNLNMPEGVTGDQPGCNPLWEIARVSDWNVEHAANGYGQSWTAAGQVGQVDFEDFYSDSASPVTTSSRWMVNEYWRSKGGSATNQAGSLLADVSPKRNAWYLVRISAVFDVDEDNDVKSCGSDWLKIGSASFETSSVADQCSAAADCLVASADNPNADQASDSANKAANRFANCIVGRAPTTNGKIAPTTKCVECFADNQCFGGQYCHLDDGICTDAVGNYYVCDSDSNKLGGLCREKSPQVLGSRCRSVYGANNGATSVSTQSVVYPGANIANPSGSGAPYGTGNTMPGAFPIKGEPTNKDFVQGSGGACGEWRYYNGSAPQSAMTGIGNANVDGTPRAALWTGVCVNGRCRECYPGERTFGAEGKVCLNGRTFSAMDVDGTVRTFAENTNASTELGTTAMVILLLIMFWTFSYAQAKRWRAANGKEDMTCCQCLLCCDACTKPGDIPAKK